MKLINKNTDYAIRAILFIAGKKDRLYSATEISESLKIPKSFLRRILQILNHKGILSSAKGKRGGFTLAVSADKIFIRDLVKIFQGKIEFGECLVRKKICPEVKKCSLKKEIDKIENYAFSRLRSLTIKSLLTEEE